MAALIDIKGAYNCVRHDQLIHQMSNLGTPARILNFINFMTFSRNLYFAKDDLNPKTTYVGVPQGGVLLPFLYNVYTSQILSHLNPNTKATIYVDDIFLYTSHKNINNGIQELNSSISKISTWLGELGFNISVPKCGFCIFSRSKINFDTYSIQINNQNVPCSKELKYLGIILDSQLSWKPHIQHITKQALKAINTLKALARVTWGASSESLLMIFKGLVRSYLEWGAIFFMGAAKYLVDKLDRIQYSALRTITGCMSSTPIYFLLVETGEVPLRVRRTYLATRFVIRNSSWSQNPLYAIYAAIKYAISANMHQLVILSDSLVAINQISNRSILNIKDSEIPYKIAELILNSPFVLNIHLIWIPSHTNIQNNRIVDGVARFSASLAVPLKRIASIGDDFSWGKKSVTSIKKTLTIQKSYFIC